MLSILSAFVASHLFFLYNQSLTFEIKAVVTVVVVVVVVAAVVVAVLQVSDSMSFPSYDIYRVICEQRPTCTLLHVQTNLDAST